MKPKPCIIVNTLTRRLDNQSRSAGEFCISFVFGFGIFVNKHAIILLSTV